MHSLWTHPSNMTWNLTFLQQICTLSLNVSCFTLLTTSFVVSRCDLRVSSRQHAVPDRKLFTTAAGVGSEASVEPPAGPSASSGPPQQTVARCLPSGGPGAAVASSRWAAKTPSHTSDRQNLLYPPLFSRMWENPTTLAWHSFMARAVRSLKDNAGIF